MHALPQSAEEDIRLLNELSGLGMALARDLQASALAAAEVGEKVAFAMSFQRTARSVRQSIALKAQLERDRERKEREAREARAPAERASSANLSIHMNQVRRQAKRIAWNELDPREAMSALADLDAMLDELAMDDDFCAVPPHVHAMRLCEELGVFIFHETGESDLAGNDDDQPDPDVMSGTAPPPRESSA